MYNSTILLYVGQNTYLFLEKNSNEKENVLIPDFMVVICACV